MKKAIKANLFLPLFIALVMCSLTVSAQNELPDNVDTSDCTVTPPAKAFDIALKWKTKEAVSYDDYYIHGRSTPLVADVDGDGKTEIVVPMSTQDAGNNNNALRPNTFITRDLAVVNGATGDIKYVIKTCDFSVHGQPIALADVDKDGKVEIYILATGPRKTSSKQLYEGKYLYCYDGSKANTYSEDCKWKSDKEQDYSFIPMIADINADGFPEVIAGGSVFNAITGTLLVDGVLEDTGMGFGGPHNVHGSWQQSKAQELGEQYYMSALADIDGDGVQELCAGNTLYKINITNINGTAGNTFSVVRQCESILPYNDMYDGQTFVLDFDNDGDLDICVLGRNKNITNFTGAVNHVGIYVWEGQTNEMIGYFACDPKTNSPSIPFSGDLDGDGYPEIIFNGWVYGQNYGAANNPDQMHVFKYQEGYTQNDNGGKAWNIKEPFTRAQCQEFFESAGFTVFDFNQDGKAEIVFRGEKNLYILDGSTLEKLCDPVTAISGTTAEYPVIADVDGDGHADILFTEEYNPSNGPGGCLSVYQSQTSGAWGPARKIWNQWPYNVVNINEDATVPQHLFDISTQFPNGTKPFNAFLQQATLLNSDGNMYLAAPDGEAIFEDSVTFQNLCDEFVIDLTYTNSGSLVLTAPYGISVYKDSLGSSLRTVKKNDDLNPGDTLNVRFVFSRNELENMMPISKFLVSVNDMGNGPGQTGGQQLECDLENNVLSHDFEGMRISEEVENPVIVCDGASYAIGEHEYTQSGDYVDTLVNRFGCDSIVHTHLHLSAIEFDFATTRYCSEELPVTLDASGSGATGFQWSTGDTTATIQAKVSDGGTDDIWEYYVIVYNSDGCLDTSNLVTIYRNPVVEITSDPDTSQFCSIGEATFTAAAININATEDVTWLWDNGETTTSIVLNTTHELTPWAEATFHECTGRDSIYIPECPCSVKFFNTLTPNGDGFNDTFAPVLEATFNFYKLVIYNRWGECVFKSKDPEESWDGTINGQEASAGTYYYVFTYACMSAPDEKVSRHGSVTLVR